MSTSAPNAPKEWYVKTDNNVIKLAQPGIFTDSLTEILLSGARAMLKVGGRGGGR